MGLKIYDIFCLPTDAPSESNELWDLIKQNLSPNIIPLFVETHVELYLVHCVFHLVIY